jgi:hypothetical protein
MIHQTPKSKSSTDTTVDGKALYLVTAGGKIKCPRCTAKSSRTKQQCGRPALNSSKTQKCGLHGGLSTGPKTAEGRQRIADAKTVHGRDTKAARLERSRGSLRLTQLEDAMHVLGMSSAKRTRGRKPNGYTPLRTIDDVCRVLIDTELHRVGSSVDGR